MNTYNVTVYWDEGSNAPLRTTITAPNWSEAQKIAESMYKGGKVVIT